MRLLNTNTFELREFLGEDLPPYTILSHVWSAEELSYEDFITGKRKDGYGYQKINKLCEIARVFGDGQCSLGWAWNDTICIDKRSSAELSEAINSMYKWYRDSAICYVFLPDVKPILDTTLSQGKETEISAEGVPFSEQRFMESRWFTRGFTLQELLAPSKVFFYNSEFQLFGQKNDLVRDQCFHPTPRSLSRLITQASGIDETVLLQNTTELALHPRNVCIAQKMSWASCRRTTKPEDIAYCLLGLFDVNMPLLYGEGAAKAFLRLQREIIANSIDDSIFAWETGDDEQPWSGLLATSPHAFRKCQHVRHHKRRRTVALATHQLTQKGIELSLSAQHRLVPRPTHPGTVACLVYPLSSWTYSVEGRLQGRCYLKLWIEDSRSGERSFADNSTLAWRSGLFILDREPEHVADRYVSVRAAMKQARGWAEPDLLQFNEAERLVFNLWYSRPRTAYALLFRLGGRVMDRVTPRWSGLRSVFKLCFPVQFEAEDTPARFLAMAKAKGEQDQLKVAEQQQNTSQW